MSPHEYMTKLDKEGTAYVVKVRFAGDEISKESSSFDVVSHSKNWIQLEGYEIQTFVNLANVASLKIKVL